MNIIQHHITFCVSTCGNSEALQMCLASVLNGTHLPKAIQIRFEGDCGGFARFYLEQLADLAKFHGIDWSMHVCKPVGIRKARDFHMDICQTPYLWMSDDDILAHPDCLKHLSKAVEDITIKDQNISYVCGSKPDINNRRGYKNFNVKIHTGAELEDNAPFNYFWDIESCAGKYAKIYTCDTGNCLINLAKIREHEIRFQQFEYSANSGGEDTIFALECSKAGLQAYFAPSARVIHLEKPNVNFNEFAARAEMTLRVCDLRDYPKSSVEYLKKVFMPWEFT